MNTVEMHDLAHSVRAGEIDSSWRDRFFRAAEVPVYRESLAASDPQCGPSNYVLVGGTQLYMWTDDPVRIRSILRIILAVHFRSYSIQTSVTDHCIGSRVAREVRATVIGWVAGGGKVCETVRKQGDESSSDQLLAEVMYGATASVLCKV